MQIQPSTAKLTPKRKRLLEAVAPQARAKTRKILVRKVRKEATPSSPVPSSPVVAQPAVVEVSSGEEPPCQKGSSSEAPEDVNAPIKVLIALRDPGATTLEDPSASAVASPSLQAPIVTPSSAGPCLERPSTASATANPPAREAASAAIVRPSARVHPREPIVPSLAIATSFSGQNLDLSELLAFDPATIGSTILEADGSSSGLTRPVEEELTNTQDFQETREDSEDQPDLMIGFLACVETL
ncbi:uncharacterized protein LOC112903589 [Panicum hallii]|uniref:uncharacterized protein LOC112903589 n=1 Tax=Panicum hallii TaxID=206008 RepID=UPI000DF4D477|nr:uncharacterized protein LOC112903589 [Panicum hallii]